MTVYFMGKVKNTKTPFEKTLLRAKIISFSGLLAVFAALLSSFLSPAKNYPAVGTALFLIAIALVPYLSLFFSVQNLEKSGSGNLITALFSILIINLGYGALIASSALTNQIEASFFLLLILGPFIYMGLRILFSIKNNIILGSGSNPIIKKIWIASALSLTLSLAIGLFTI